MAAASVSAADLGENAVAIRFACHASGNSGVVRALSLIPVVYAIAALIYLSAVGGAGWPLGVAQVLVTVLSVVLLVRSILHIRRNDRLSSDAKITWVLLAVLLGLVALPIYWWVIAHRPSGGSHESAGAASA